MTRRCLQRDSNLLNLCVDKLNNCTKSHANDKKILIKRSIYGREISPESLHYFQGKEVTDMKEMALEI